MNDPILVSASVVHELSRGSVINDVRGHIGVKKGKTPHILKTLSTVEIHGNGSCCAVLASGWCSPILRLGIFIFVYFSLCLGRKIHGRPFTIR